MSTPQRPPSNVSAESSMKSKRRQSRDKENVELHLNVNGCNLAGNDPSIKQGLQDVHNASAYATPTSSAMDETNNLPIKNTFAHFDGFISSETEMPSLRIRLPFDAKYLPLLNHTRNMSTPPRPPRNVSAESSTKSKRCQSRDMEGVKPRLNINGCNLAVKDPSNKQGLKGVHNASAYATPTSSAMDETNNLPIKNTFIHFDTILPPMRQSRKSWPMRRPDEINIKDHHMTSGETYGALGESKNDAKIVAAVLGSLGDRSTWLGDRSTWLPRNESGLVTEALGERRVGGVRTDESRDLMNARLALMNRRTVESAPRTEQLIDSTRHVLRLSDFLPPDVTSSSANCILSPVSFVFFTVPTPSPLTALPVTPTQLWFLPAWNAP